MTFTGVSINKKPSYPCTTTHFCSFPTQPQKWAQQLINYIRTSLEQSKMNGSYSGKPSGSQSFPLPEHFTSNCSTDYTIGAPIGFGASSTVYVASYNPSSGPSIPCALKVLDLDSLPPHSLSLLHRETQLMSLSKHPNVIRVRGTWMNGHKLYIAMRLMNKGR